MSDSTRQPLLAPPEVEQGSSQTPSVGDHPSSHPPSHPRSRLSLAQPLHDRAVPAATNPLAREHWSGVNADQGKLWTPDRGAGFYQTERERYHKPSLVATGKYVFIPVPLLVGPLRMSCTKPV